MVVIIVMVNASPYAAEMCSESLKMASTASVETHSTPLTTGNVQLATRAGRVPHLQMRHPIEAGGFGDHGERAGNQAWEAITPAETDRITAR